MEQQETEMYVAQPVAGLPMAQLLFPPSNKEAMLEKFQLARQIGQK